MSRVLLHIILLMLALNCKGQAFDYPSEIKAKGLEKLYDKTKWYLYCITSDQTLEFTIPSGRKSKSTIAFGTLPLRFDHLEIRKDTVEIDFFFYYNGKRVDAALIENYPPWGAVFELPSDSIILFSSRSTARYYWLKCEDMSKCPYREVKPLQPEVIKYIKQNKNKLDPWFRKEAIKRGVISE